MNETYILEINHIVTVLSANLTQENNTLLPALRFFLVATKPHSRRADEME